MPSRFHNSTEIKGSSDFLKLNPELTQEKAAKPSKFHNVATESDGMLFQSGHEAERAGELNRLLKAGEIFCLQYQVRIPVAAKVDYIADFVYLDKQLNPVFEDAKGFRTDVFKLKKKLFIEKYNKVISEV